MDQNCETYKKWQPFLLGLCAMLGLWGGLNMRQADPSGSQVLKNASTHADQSQKIKDVLSYIQSKYMDTIDLDAATDLALEAFLSNLDPYSEYIPSKLMHRYSDQIQGKLRGIGMNLVNVDSQLIVSQIRPHSPASYKGINVGDYILEIDNQSSLIFNGNADSIQYRIENFESDSIQITWKNRMQNQIKKEKLPIEELDEHAVSDVFIPEKQILYLRLNQLSKDSYREFMKALEHYFESGQCKNLIIDLRGNSGGLVHEAAYILNQLIDEKDVLMFKTAGIKVKEKEFRTTGKPFFRVDKIAVLVNHETASAAELLAATLQDLDRAIIIGTPTFGKATVLEQFSLGDGSAIRLAVSRYYTNSGRSIQKNYEKTATCSYLGQSASDQDSIFYSIKKHKLASHVGVIPDIIIPNRDIENPDSLSSWEIADRIAGKYFVEFKTMIQNNPDNIIQNIKISQLIKQAILNDASLVGQSKKIDKVEEECKYALTRWFFGEGLEQRMRLLKDENLATAVEHLKIN